MYTLYYLPGACSMAVHVVLHEIGADFSLSNVSKLAGKTKDPEFLKINPRGAVPALETEGKVLVEGAAIMLYLAEKHNSALLPKSGWERAKAMEWLMFCNATLHPVYSRAFGSFRLEDKTLQGQIQKMSLEQATNLWKEVERQLNETPYLTGSEITLADILLTVIGNWIKSFPGHEPIGSKTKQLFQRVIQRPSYQKALQTEQVEYKAAA